MYRFFNLSFSTLIFLVDRFITIKILLVMSYISLMMNHYAVLPQFMTWKTRWTPTFLRSFPSTKARFTATRTLLVSL